MLPLLLALSLGADAPQWTLDEALAAFSRASPELVQARLRERAAAGEVTQAGLRPNPQASLSLGNLPLRANATPSGNGAALGRNWAGTVGLTQTLELGGKRSARLAAARRLLEAARLSTEDAVRTGRFELARAFWQALVARAHLDLALEIRDRYQETVRLFRARFAADDVSKGDLDKIELEALRQQNDLDDARAEERAAIQDLLQLVGPGAPPAVTVVGELAEPLQPLPDAAALERRAEAQRADVRAAERRVEASRASLDLARAQAVPDLDLGIAWTHSRAIPAGDNPDVLALTVGLPLPLFDRNQGGIEKAAAEEAAAEAELAATRARVAREAEAALARLGAARDKVARYQDGTLDRADRALRVAERAWREGATSLLGLLEAERTWIALRQDYLDTLYELRVARLEVERAAGSPFPVSAP